MQVIVCVHVLLGRYEEVIVSAHNVILNDRSTHMMMMMMGGGRSGLEYDAITSCYWRSTNLFISTILFVSEHRTAVPCLQVIPKDVLLWAMFGSSG
jgi:hypothetical protein